MLSHQPEFVLFVGGLPPNCPEGDLWGLFSDFGPVQDLSVKEKYDGNYVELYSLVTYSEEVCAANALRCLNGFNFYGYQLKVRWATQIAVKQSHGEQPIINSLYMKFTSREVSFYITEEDIYSIFSEFGNVASVHIKDLNLDVSLHRQTGYGFVHFVNTPEGTQQALRAINVLNRNSRNGISFSVEPSKNFLKQFPRQQIPIQLDNYSLSGPVTRFQLPLKPQQQQQPAHYGFRNSGINNQDPYRGAPEQITQNAADYFERRPQMSNSSQRTMPSLVRNTALSVQQPFRNRPESGSFDVLSNDGATLSESFTPSSTDEVFSPNQCTNGDKTGISLGWLGLTTKASEYNTGFSKPMNFSMPTEFPSQRNMRRDHSDSTVSSISSIFSEEDSDLKHANSNRLPTYTAGINSWF